MEREILGLPVAWLAIASAATFVVTLILIPVLIVRMPADYFVAESPAPESFRGRPLREPSFNASQPPSR